MDNDFVQDMYFIAELSIDPLTAVIPVTLGCNATTRFLGSPIV
jgi:hypothetical protein